MSAQIVTSIMNWDRQYQQFLRIFCYSAEQYVGVTPVVLKIDDGNVARKRGKSFGCNSAKLRAFSAFAQKTDFPIAFMDCDMIVTGPVLKPLLEDDFDIGVTRRDMHAKYRYNGGTIFYQPTKAATAFLARWSQVNDMMYTDNKFHKPWHKKYAGINQASLGYMLEEEAKKVRIKEFPTWKYNSCDHMNWIQLRSSDFGERVCVVHCKSDLRRALKRYDSRMGQYKAILELWTRLDKASQGYKVKLTDAPL